MPPAKTTSKPIQRTNMMNRKILILLLLTIAQLYAQTCFGIASTDNSVCSSAGACVSDDKCSCYSGYDGMECAHKAPSSCTFNNNTMTKTDFYPFLDSQSISFDNNNLKLVIQAPLVNDRLDTKIYIQNNTFTDCAYPGNYTGNYLDEAGVCYNRFNYTLPWAAGKNCGWELTETDDQQTYTGNMYIEQKENLGTVRGQPIQRTIKSVLPLTVTFQKRVSVVTSIKVYSPVTLISAVTKQQYIAGPPKAGLIEFITSLQYPFQIDTAQTLSVHTFPAGIVPTLRNVSENCLPDQPCTQTFEMDLAVGAACSFTGLYKATFLLKCHPSIQDPLDCPLDTNRNVDVEFNVNSENFCSVVAVNINLQGTLKAYQEVGHTTRKTAFLIGQTAYFNAETSSTQATLQESKLVRVQWSNENVTKVLYDNFTITADGTTESFVVGTFGANSAAFQFNLLDSSMNIPTDSNLNFTISALLEIKYQSISGNSETAYKETTFSIKDRKQLLSSVAPVEGHQRSKFSETIKIFGHYKPVSESGSISFSLILLISFVIFTLF